MVLYCGLDGGNRMDKVLSAIFGCCCCKDEGNVAAVNGILSVCISFSFCHLKDEPVSLLVFMKESSP